MTAIKGYYGDTKIYFDDELTKDQFKMFCAGIGRSMNSVTLDLLKEAVKSVGEEEEQI